MDLIELLTGWKVIVNGMRSLAARVLGVSAVMRINRKVLVHGAVNKSCRLMKKERISIHLLKKNHYHHCKDVLNVKTVKGGRIEGMLAMWGWIQQIWVRVGRLVINAGAKIIVSDTDRDVKKSDGSFNDFPSKIKWWVKRINKRNKRFKVRFAATCSTKKQSLM